VVGVAGEANTIRVGQSGTQQNTFIAGISGKTVASGVGVTVRYEAVNAMLLNKFLNEHQKAEQQQRTIARLQQEFQAKAAGQQQQIEALTAGLHAVRAEVELHLPGTRTAGNK
jgi:hypothetical protein